MQFGESELRRAVDGDEEVEPPLRGVNLSDVHLEVADGIFGELLLRRLVTADLRLQPAQRDIDPLSLTPRFIIQKPQHLFSHGVFFGAERDGRKERPHFVGIIIG
jgi:hypothetical protein